MPVCRRCRKQAVHHQDAASALRPPSLHRDPSGTSSREVPLNPSDQSTLRYARFPSPRDQSARHSPEVAPHPPKRPPGPLGSTRPTLREVPPHPAEGPTSPLGSTRPTLREVPPHPAKGPTSPCGSTLPTSSEVPPHPARPSQSPRASEDATSRTTQSHPARLNSSPLRSKHPTRHQGRRRRHPLADIEAATTTANPCLTQGTPRPAGESVPPHPRGRSATPRRAR
jgi:hypothetical protein